jgi:GT2 family glycosyltransferase
MESASLKEKVEDAASPLATVLITAFNRPEELRYTLESLHAQTYMPLEILIIDDASEHCLEPIVLDVWPKARVIRNSANRGYIANRSTGIALAKGKYIVSLDDDSNFTRPDDISRAVERVEREPEIGILAFQQVQGRKPKQPLSASGPERYSTSYFGCGHLLRGEMVRQLGGYQNWFNYYAEETEYSMRALQAGWRILEFPSVAVHHRVSAVGRSTKKIYRYSFRNSLNTIVLRFPFPRMLIELLWKVFLYGWIGLRQGYVSSFAWAFASFCANLPQAWRLRSPLSKEKVRLYDLLRSRRVADTPDIALPGSGSLFEVAASRCRFLRWVSSISI